MKKYIYIAFIVFLPLAVSAQVKCKSMIAKVVMIEDGKMIDNVVMKKGEENRIKVITPDCFEKINHEVYVSSRNAIIKRDEENPGEYLVIPQDDEKVQVIVDVETYEEYLYYKKKKKKNKVKKVISKASPKKYMMVYENFAVM